MESLNKQRGVSGVFNSTVLLLSCLSHRRSSLYINVLVVNLAWLIWQWHSCCRSRGS